MYKLQDIAHIIPGYSFRGAIKPNINGNLLVLQPKDIVRGEILKDAHGLTRVSEEVSGYNGYLEPNDVLLVARGMKSGSFRSTVFGARAPNVIASSSVHIIRLRSKDVLPEFLSSYLNSSQGQAALIDIVTGSYIGAIPRRELEKIRIPIPPLKTQKSIADLEENIKKQDIITERKKQLKQQIIEATFRNIILKSK